ncbi:pyruvate formate lyase family protein [Shigella flexneri]
MNRNRICRRHHAGRERARYSLPALVDDCIERAKSIKQGGAKYDWVSRLQVGIANLGNSLAAVKKLVFEQARLVSNSWLPHWRMTSMA